MAELVGYEQAAGVVTLRIDNPPVNALGQALRAALAAALAKAEADPLVGAVVLAAAGRGWPVGADIREFGQPPQAPTLPDLCAAFAAAGKPVIAAITGSALGGGLELALCAAWRLADGETRLGLPEVSLGILPGAGGTQRLPGLIGAAAALEMMLSGAPVLAQKALDLGLIDKITGKDVVAAAQALAQAHVDGRQVLPLAAQRRTPGRSDVATYLAAVAAARVLPRGPQERAAPRIIDCVEAALLLPPAQGLVFERAAFAELVVTPEAKALRHAFLAERRGAKSLPAPGVPLPDLSRITVVGGGAIGAGLTTALLSAGLSVTLIEANAQTLSLSLARIARAQEAAVARGEMSAEARLAGWSRLHAVPGLAALNPADPVIEALPEALHLKAPVLAALGAALAADVPVMSVTCGLDPLALAAATGRPDLHLSLYLSEPVRRMTLVELAAAEGLRAEAVAVLQALAARLGWRLLRQGPLPGFLSQRLWTSLGDAADRCLAAGATPHEIDRALRAYGLPLGAYELRDLYGLDHALPSHPLRRAGGTAGPVGRMLAEWLMAQGRMGRRGGLGYHHYEAVGKPSRADAEVMAEADRLRPRQRLFPAEIQRRVLAGLANDGAWALVEGRARQPSDIDLVALAQGFPRWRGGPMQAADQAGLLGLRNELTQWAQAGDGFWQPAPLWDELIRNGRHFGDLNAG